MKSRPSPLDPQVLALLGGLSVQVDHVVEGVLAGLHRSHRFGENDDFAEHKPYTAGDDPRHIDWKVLGRLDRVVMKKFTAESDAQAVLALDCSGSMSYRSGAFSKTHYSAILAACLAKLFLRQGDGVGFLMGSEQPQSGLQPRRNPEHMVAVLDVLENMLVGGKTNINRIVERYLATIHRRGMLVLFSDLFDFETESLTGLKIAAARGHEVIVFHVLDRDEIEFPFEDPCVFHSMEDNGRLGILPREVRRAYLAEMHKFLDHTARCLVEAGVKYELAVTDEAPHKPLIRRFQKRIVGWKIF